MTVWLMAPLLVLFMAGSGYTGTLNDPFSTNPYPTRWCERWHDVTWNSTLGQMQGVNASTCTGAGHACCQGSCPICCPAAGCTGVSGDGVFFAVTTASQEGVTAGLTRSAEILFALPTHLSTNPAGAHLALFGVASGFCHQGTEATVGIEANQTYRLGVVTVNGKQAGYTGDPHYCNDLGTSAVFTPGTTSLAVGTTPRYKISVSTSLIGVPPSLYALAAATLVDTQTNTTLLNLPTHSYTALVSWRNGTIKRFGFAGIRPAGASSIRWDNFIGMAQ